MIDRVLSDPLAILGLVFFLFFLGWMWRVSHSDSNTYSLSDLITTKGRMDLSKVGQLVCLITTTWIVVHMELKSVVAEWALGLYMLAWVGAGFGSLYARLKGSPAATTEAAGTPTESAKGGAP